MIRRFFCALLAAAILCLGAAQAAENHDLVRLQVVATDDSPQAQALKLALRDVCLRGAELCLADAADADAAYMALQAHLEDFQAACERRAQELGWDVEIRAEAGVFEFPDRIYGQLLVPAGQYRALRVTIGAGAGHNWWCVLYPSLCVLDEADAGTEMDVWGVLAWLECKIGGIL